jgi:hypothetical protein
MTRADATLILRSRPQAGVSKDEATDLGFTRDRHDMMAQVGYSRLVRFETRRYAALLTMRIEEAGI